MTHFERFAEIVRRIAAGVVEPSMLFGTQDLHAADQDS